MKTTINYEFKKKKPASNDFNYSDININYTREKKPLNIVTEIKYTIST